MLDISIADPGVLWDDLTKQMVRLCGRSRFEVAGIWVQSGSGCRPSKVEITQPVRPAGFKDSLLLRMLGI